MKISGFIAALLIVQGILNPVNALAVHENLWHFKVSLDGKQIGQHSFKLTNKTIRQRLSSEADFLVKFLFINAYYYEHQSTEYWDGDCLQQIESNTVDNGSRYQVSGKRESAGFKIMANEKERLLPECVMTFAYWNPKMLAQKRLLNSQTGEYIPVQIDFKGQENLISDNRPVLTSRYDLRSDKLKISLWYETESKQWLALESVTPDDHLLRYERIAGEIGTVHSAAGAIVYD